MFYWFAYLLCKIISLILGGVKYIGKENLPKDESFIMASNHKSNLDPFLVGLGLEVKLAFIAKDSLFQNPILRWMLVHVNAYPIDRSGNPRKAINQTVEVLKDNNPLVIFPEGTRNKEDYSLREFKKGASLIAIEAGVKIIPVAVFNSRKTFGRKLVVYGEAIIPPKEDNRKNRDELTRKLRDSISNLIEENLNSSNKKYLIKRR